MNDRMDTIKINDFMINGRWKVNVGRKRID